MVDNRKYLIYDGEKELFPHIPSTKLIQNLNVIYLKAINSDKYKNLNVRPYEGD